MRVAVIGAGIGGLAAAIRLAAQGQEVVLLDQAQAYGGKMHAQAVGGALIDSGPTVLTLRGVFDALFESAGARLDEAVTLTPAKVIARHAWSDKEWLDLYADLDASADAIGLFAGAQAARQYRAFCAESARVFDLLEPTFLNAQQVGVIGLTRRVGLSRLGELAAIRPFESLWDAMGRRFSDPRLRQLFSRYSTYCGASPFRAPATLMLIAHAERKGVWLVEGGMQRLAEAMAALATRVGVEVRLGAQVETIETASGRVSGVRLADGEQIAAGAVVMAGDPQALAQGLLGPAVRKGARRSSRRSLSAVTFALTGRLSGRPLDRHTVLFSRDYEAEFAELAAGEMPRTPTVYICAQDRPGAPADPERLFLLVNAPANGDRPGGKTEMAKACEQAVERRLKACGLRLNRASEPLITTPADWAARFPGTGGALYGPPMHGWGAAFSRPGARTRVPGLYLAGGGAHPGAGVPMAAPSGALAAQALMEDLGSTPRSRRAATPGGTSTP